MIPKYPIMVCYIKAANDSNGVAIIIHRYPRYLVDLSCNMISGIFK